MDEIRLGLVPPHSNPGATDELPYVDMAADMVGETDLQAPTLVILPIS